MEFLIIYCYFLIFIFVFSSFITKPKDKMTREVSNTNDMKAKWVVLLVFTSSHGRSKIQHIHLL